MSPEKPTEEVIKPEVTETVAATTPTPAVEKPVLTDEQLTKLNQQKEFFFRLRQGGIFLKFIYNDIERQKKEHCNRHQRRRFEKELKKGQFSKELVEVYTEQIAQIEAYITEQLNPAPKVDGAEWFKKVKEAEAKGEVPPLVTPKEDTTGNVTQKQG